MNDAAVRAPLSALFHGIWKGFDEQAAPAKRFEAVGDRIPIPVKRSRFDEETVQLTAEQQPGDYIFAELRREFDGIPRRASGVPQRQLRLRCRCRLPRPDKLHLQYADLLLE